MSHRLTPILLILGLVLVGCATPEDDTIALDEVAIGEIQNAVTARMNELITHAAAGDLESAFTLFDQSGPGSYIDGVHRYASFQEVWDSYRANWNIASQDFGDLKTRVIVLSPEYALSSSASAVTQVDTLGVESQVVLAVTHIWVRKDGQWLMHSFHQDVEPLDPVPTE